MTEVEKVRVGDRSSSNRHGGNIGGYYDFESSTRDGETAFLQVAALPKGESLAGLPKSWFLNTVFSVDGRYSSYGAPTDVKLKEVDKGNEARTFEVSFNVLSPQLEVTRKGVLRAVPAKGRTRHFTAPWRPTWAWPSIL